MDLEAIQLLNLSPIPELSEIELSTMLEQLSGLSDLNGDLTDRNVEDILKEAEDLLERSCSSGLSAVVNQSLSLTTNLDTIEQESLVIDKTESKESQKKEENLNQETKHYNSPVKKSKNINEVTSSPVQQSSNRIFSPGSSINHIKSTIDSLKEFSTVIEKQLSSRSENSSPKENKTKTKVENERNTDDHERIQCILNSPQSKSLENKKKKLKSGYMDKSIKMLNCFERLYQDRPMRLSTALKNPKFNDKVTKTTAKKKQINFNDKTIVKGKSNQAVRKTTAEENNPRVNEQVNQNFASTKTDYSAMMEDWLRISRVSSGCSIPSTQTKVPKNEESENELVHSPKDIPSNGDNPKNSNIIDEKLILRLLQEMEEIKNQVRKAGVGGGEVPEEVMRESQVVIDVLRSEVESMKEKVTSESIKTAGIQRLEEQFSLLKQKYDQHMEKLESENMKLREELNSQAKFSTSSVSGNTEISATAVMGFPTETKNHQLSVTETPSTAAEEKLVRNEDVQTSTRVKEAFSQTEKELRNMSIQCVQEEKPKSEDGISRTDSMPEEKSHATKTENKENVSSRKRPTKCKPFSDVHQLMKQKKVISDHETRLLVTLRGLQAEVSLKDKETRKLKTEIDLLRSQIKRLTRCRGEVPKRCHAGTQTIGLGPIVQRPYNPEIYEVSDEFRRENEELKLRVKGLEEDFEFLRERRISDLQALHQVHEEEMAKLVSKLETQSALTKHLHSLLVNR